MWLLGLQQDGGVGEIPMQVVLAVLGGLALAGSVVVMFNINDKSDWLQATGQILSVDRRCELSERTIGSGYSYRRGPRLTPQSVSIPCDQVDRFKADNPGRDWRLSQFYSGQVRIVGAGASFTKDMPLPYPSRAPHVGDRLDLIQNPDAPTEIAVVSPNGDNVALAAFAGGLGVVLLFLAFFWF